ncbi:hypothetical protein LMG31884_13770 [Xanthomonas hydrangeae]|nr:hypothetical protein LMG31884_13770 [Xanthomonas hydrangeae]CAD7714939.1 hypothetical protein LMG31884_13770 [Xanthomonas hydrangeae]CAD7725784.1 hypothetical protein LMG31887_13780 [Xanthomonas hydrangeae]CAD7725788.1 hypothetical protein LMG31887_13780 [Xanthomonas hydrangeae]
MARKTRSAGVAGYTGLDKRAEMARKRKLRYLIAEKLSKLKQIKIDTHPR